LVALKERWPSLILVFVMLIVKLWRKKSNPAFGVWFFAQLALQLSPKFGATERAEFN
jgi:hypothetical protein